MSESLRIDETAPAASLALESRESLFSAVVVFVLLLGSADFPGGDLAFPKGAFQTVMGTAANGWIPSSPKGFPASAIGPEGAADPKPEGPQPTKANPAQALRQGKLGATTPALAYGQGDLKAPPTSEPWQGPTDPF